MRTLSPAVLVLLACAGAATAQNAGVRPVLRSIGSISDPLQARDPSTVALRGVVTLARKHAIYVQDQTGAMAAIPQNGEQASLAIGDEVELQGRFEGRDALPVLNAVSIRKLWPGSPPVPLSLKPAQAAEGSFRGRLIDIEGRLLEKHVVADYLRLTLEGDGQIFGATLELSSPPSRDSPIAKNLEEGSTLRLVGVCAPRSSPDEAVVDAFIVLLRSTDDIRVIAPGPWWNARHLLLAGLGILCCLAIAYRIHHRTLNLRFQAIVDERSRIAREIHDTLAQGFSGLTYQIEGLMRELNAPAERESIERHLSMALHLVRHCREEAHRSIFALRSLAQSNPDLLNLLTSSCSSLHARNDVRIIGAREGRPVPIPDDTLNHLLRIGQEAITNALQHAQATEIRVHIRFEAGAITLKIHDNGAGFDLSSVRSVESGRFGITGMRERVKHIQATLQIDSRMHAGTTVTVRAPLKRTPRDRERTAMLPRVPAPNPAESSGD